jgi:hypothetical protein
LDKLNEFPKLLKKAYQPRMTLLKFDHGAESVEILGRGYGWSSVKRGFDLNCFERSRKQFYGKNVIPAPLCLRKIFHPSRNQKIIPLRPKFPGHQVVVKPGIPLAFDVSINEENLRAW